MIYVYKKKVWSCFVYFQEGCGKTRIKINDAIPHTRIDMAHRHAHWGTPRLVYNKNECCPLCPLIRWKLPHFLERTVRKHFQYVCLTGYLPKDDAKVKNVSQQTTLISGVLPCCMLLDFWIYRPCPVPDWAIKRISWNDDDRGQMKSLLSLCWGEAVIVRPLVEKWPHCQVNGNRLYNKTTSQRPVLWEVVLFCATTLRQE